MVENLKGDLNPTDKESRKVHLKVLHQIQEGYHVQYFKHLDRGDDNLRGDPNPTHKESWKVQPTGFTLDAGRISYTLL